MVRTHLIVQKLRLFINLFILKPFIIWINTITHHHRQTKGDTHYANKRMAVKSFTCHCKANASTSIML